LQGTGEASGAILPDWLSGYAFVFPAVQDLEHARQLRAEVKTVRTWTLGYDNNDPLARLIAERIALNAKDAGLAIDVVTSSNADLRLERTILASLNPWVALEARDPEAKITHAAGGGDSVDDLFKSESTELAKQQTIPLFYLPGTYALSLAVENWGQHRDGMIDFEDLWMGSRP